MNSQLSFSLANSFVYKPNLTAIQLFEARSSFSFITIVCRSSAKPDILRIKKNFNFSEHYLVVYSRNCGLSFPFSSFSKATFQYNQRNRNFCCLHFIRGDEKKIWKDQFGRAGRSIEELTFPSPEAVKKLPVISSQSLSKKSSCIFKLTFCIFLLLFTT